MCISRRVIAEVAFVLFFFCLEVNSPAARALESAFARVSRMAWNAVDLFAAYS